MFAQASVLHNKCIRTYRVHNTQLVHATIKTTITVATVNQGVCTDLSIVVTGHRYVCIDVRAKVTPTVCTVVIVVSILIDICAFARSRE